MLKIKPLFAVALFSLISVPLSPSKAQAEEHVVIILEAAFFPQNIELKHGDRVRFANESGYATAITQAAGGWTTPSIPPGAELLVTIEPGMTGGFFGKTRTRIVGRLDFDRSGATD